ncbi:MAG: S8 family serine peptidase [Hyphomicrobiales bacterium]
MKIGIVRATVAVVVFTLGSFVALAQERPPDVVRLLMEQKAPPAPLFVPGEVIVRMRGPAKLNPADMTRFGVQEKVQITSGGEIIYRIPPPLLGTMSTERQQDRTLQLARELSARPDVEYAQLNYILRISRTPNDPRYPEQWHYFNNGTGPGQSPGGINLPTAWDTSTGSSAIVVAVIDTGILPNHPDIQGSPNLVAGYDMISDPAMANDGDGRDSDPTDPGDAVATNECFPGSPALPASWHGTHVAGTIGVGNTNNGIGVAGINWNVKVQPVRVLGKCGGTTVDINDGIRWAAGLPVPGVPNNPTPAKVINMSLGTPPGSPCSMSPSTQSAINDAVAMGTTVVVAAGNDATDASQVFPASCNNVITVAAGDYRGFLATRYSNFGSTVEIMAPGGDVSRDDNNDGRPDGVLSMVDPSAGTYAYYNGTSMAAPHVAGVAALLLAQEPTLVPSQVLSRLQANALPRNSTQCPQPCGAGLLSAVAGGVTPQPPQPVALALSLDSNDLGKNDSTFARARVTQGGAPVAGKTVAFASANPSVASVSPATSVTDGSGQAVSIVKGESQGETTVRATANGATDTKTVKVPDLSLLGVAFIIVLALIISARRNRTNLDRP